MADSMDKKYSNVPNLRFPEFNDDLHFSNLADIFTISAGGDIDKGAVREIKDGVYKYPVVANALTNEGIYGYTDTYKQENCVTVTGRGEIGIAKARPYRYFPIVRLLSLKPKNEVDLKYFECLINSKTILNESTGVPQLTSPQISKIKVNYCNYEEQRKIGQLLTTIDERISTQNKIIRDLKVLIKRFLDFDYKTNTSEYEDVLLSSILTESKILNSNNNEVYSVAVEDGVVNQVEHLGRSFAAKDTSNYHVAKYGDIIYTKSPTGSFPYGIVKQSFIKNDVAVSPLYGIYHPNSYEIGYYIHHYFLYAINCNNYLHPLVNKGAKNTMNITNTRFLEGKILVPNNNERVINIHHFLHVINKKLQNEIAINNKLLDQKAFLLKNLFI